MGLVNFLIKIGLDTTDVQLGTKRVESAFTGLAQTVGKSLGVFGFGSAILALGKLAQMGVKAADTVGDLAEQYALTTEEVQKLQALSGRTGVDFEKFGNLLLKISELRAKALTPGEDGQKARDQFASFGVDLNKPLLDVATQLSVALKGQTDNAAALDMVSVRGAKALSVLRGIKDLGPISLINKVEVDNLSKVDNLLGEIWRKIGAGSAGVGSAFFELISSGGDIVKARAEYQRKLRESFKKTEPEAQPQLDVFGNLIGGGGSAARGIFAKGADNKAWLDSEKEKKKAAEPLLFRSSNPDAGAAGGAFYFGADRQARLDIGQRTLAVQEKVLTEVKAMRGEVQTLLRP
jgi:hypothetical protein